MTATADASPGDNNAQWHVTPLTDRVGVEISGIDLKTVDEAQARDLEALFNTHSALLFRDQQLEPADLVRFSRMFGALDEAPVMENGKTAVDGFPEIYVISNIKGADGKDVGSLGSGEAVWHTDMSYLDNPPRASMLYSVEIPSAGGNTWLSGMYAALDAMPGELRDRIEGRRIKHDGTYNSGGFVRQGVVESDDPRTAVGTFHPAICKHYGSGKEVLFLGRRRNAYVEGLSLEESEALLDELWSYAAKPEFTYSHTWRVGDLLMWDNRATLHRRDPFDASERRYMLRTQIKGDAAPSA